MWVIPTLPCKLRLKIKQQTTNNKFSCLKEISKLAYTEKTLSTSLLTIYSYFVSSFSTLDSRTLWYQNITKILCSHSYMLKVNLVQR